MKRRNGLVRTCVFGALLSSVAWAAPGMQAQAGDLPVKAPVVEPVPYWWFHGEVEAGGRFFLNNPQRNGANYLGQNSLAKFYEYRDLRPGPFGNIWLATGTSDGLYQIDVGGKNIGYDDQRFYLDASKAGEHYFNFIWDQTPHLYSTSAMTPYLGVGTNALTLNKTVTAAAGAAGFVSLNFNPIDIGIKRDTASAEYRWTPTDAWDVKADYSHMRRTGTQVDGITGLAGSAFGGAVQVPKPVQDTTQNYGLNGEYAGTSSWNQKYTFKLGYSGSQYSDDFSSYTVQSPLTVNSTGESQIGRMSTWPSNNANAFSGTLAADLPWKSRYVGTLSYNMMRQNDAFMPMTINPTATAAAQLLPASSLNGAINTLLSNNVLTSKITPELTNKLSYRYYNFDNQTPELLFPSWVSYDHVTPEAAIRSLSISYTKQNAGEELVWRPTREWNLGAAYGYERYDWTRDSVDVTNEHSGKVFADWKPTSWVTLRSSGFYSDRRYNNYDYNANVAAIQFPGRGPVDSWFISPAYRQMMTDNRQRWKANFAIDMVVLPGLTITPNFKYQDDYYGLNAANQLGLTDSRSWNGGIDVTYVFNPRASIMVGYVREYYTQLLLAQSCTTFGVAIGAQCSAGPPATTNVRETTNDRTVVDTFTVATRFAAIPDKLDLNLRYTLSHGVDNQNLNLISAVNGAQGASPACPTGVPAGTCQFPDVTTWFQRLDATAIYTFDKTDVAQSGLKGVVKAKLHYAWERNAVANWANDPVALYNPVIASSALFMAGNNPNYNVHLLMASLAYTW